MRKKYIYIPDLPSIREAASEFIDSIGASMIVAISGEMGAGKTTLIQAVCKELGVSDVVSSPTFALINEYFTESGESIYHLDLYRIDNPEELFDIGYEDYLYSGSLCFIEWPEKAMELIPPETLHAKIEVMKDGSRRIRIGNH